MENLPQTLCKNVSFTSLYNSSNWFKKPFLREPGDTALISSISWNRLFANICCLPLQIREPKHIICFTVNSSGFFFLFCRGCQLSRWSLNVAQDTFAFTLLKAESDLMSNASSMRLGCIHTRTQSCRLVIGSRRTDVDARSEQRTLAVSKTPAVHANSVYPRTLRVN